MLHNVGLHSNQAEVDDTPAYKPIPLRSLSELNLNDELANQLNIAQNIMAEIRHTDTPANQKAQMLNSINSIIKQIIDMEEILHNVETVKKIENALINSLKKFPDLQEAFYAEYGQRLGSP